MPKSTATAHPVKSRELALRLSETAGNARREAVGWLANQLRWERTLDAVRAQIAGR